MSERRGSRTASGLSRLGWRYVWTVTDRMKEFSPQNLMTYSTPICRNVLLGFFPATRPQFQVRPDGFLIRDAFETKREELDATVEIEYPVDPQE